ncbi:triacylglycerol lipase [Actinoplanes lutulentus]|uniref:Triacylglycerol lipase n=1 Tax=Actinoplanes lutulentus TaxID=1287878 RepID=A0A327Z5B0_9ACTN|nr:alpha/beta fold hydrolase [Actinoplanes lutulentus]MBB2940324.1 triacylglycerol lipase [Actinoplanes lutulentus]RAK28817.1 triacylglycerol lipase [Actinoplanes lutulentus]
MRRLVVLLTAVLAALALSPALPATAAPGTPVVFVHGYTGSASNWTTAISVFRAGGYASSELFAYEYNSYGNNITNAQGLATYVSQVRARTGAAQVDIVNHSMGGLVSQWYLKQLGGNQYVRHLASIAGANHGTTAAGACLIYVTCQQMYPGSSFINTLSSGDETPGSTRYGTWYSPCDGVIVPYTSTTLSGATNNYVVCQTHLGFLTDTGTLTQIRSFLAT